MHYIPCNSALLSLCLAQKGIVFATKNVCSGLKFSSESKLFGVGPPCHRPTSATPILNIFNLVKRRKREEKSTFFLSSCSLVATWSTSTEKSEPSPRPQYIRPEIILNFKQQISRALFFFIGPRSDHSLP